MLLNILANSVIRSAPSQFHNQHSYKKRAVDTVKKKKEKKECLAAANNVAQDNLLQTGILHQIKYSSN